MGAGRRCVHKLQAFMLLTILAFAYMAPAVAVPPSRRQAAAAVSESSPVVLIDAGHGAMDSGKVGVNHVLEKDINLAIAGYVYDALCEAGVKTVMTRTDDSPLYNEQDRNKKLSDMRRRIAIMEENQADLAVSIHQNSYTQESVKGPQVFYYKDSVEGKKLAQRIQASFDAVLGAENTRTIKPNGEYYLLVHSPMPLVICECGFLSNWEEAERLATPAYQKQMAEAIANGILEYLGLANR